MGKNTYVVVPVYNERKTLEGVLGKLERLGEAVHGLVMVDDGSSDGSAAVIDDWAKTHPNVTVLRHSVNRGYSQALLTGFNHLVERVGTGEVSDQDILATIDADGQHDPLDLPRLLETMEAEGLDVVWARRDFTLYPRFKRWGNAAMSLMAWPFSGRRFKDVESGYCVFRIGALAHALQVRTRDWRYSISLSLAVILARLGYRISNEPMVNIPLYRSRTRILDVFTDTMAAANAWAAVTFAPLRTSRMAQTKFVIGVLAAFIVVAAVALAATKTIFLGFDSINNYVHVRYISEHLFDTGTIPWRNTALENGKALTYPYGFFPWTLAALLFRVLGDYAVTLTTVTGFVLMMVVVQRTRLRGEPWLFVLFLLVPSLMEALLSFQLSFVWGALFAYLYVHSLEKDRRVQAWVWFVLALSTHLLVLGSLLIIYNACAWVLVKEHRRRILWTSLLSLPVAIPVAWYTLQTPSLGQNDPVFLFLDTLGTLGPRAFLFFMPFFLVWGKKHVTPRWSVALAGILLVISLGTNIPFGQVSGLFARSTNVYADYLDSPAFVPGAIYRMLEPSDREQGHYYFVRRGAVLGQELFSESQARIDWKPDKYTCFIEAKPIDFVVVNRDYLTSFDTNERDLLNGFVRKDSATVAYADPEGRFSVYDVRSIRAPDPPPVRSCL